MPARPWVLIALRSEMAGARNRQGLQGRRGAVRGSTPRGRLRRSGAERFAQAIDAASVLGGGNQNGHRPILGRCHGGGKIAPSHRASRKPVEHEGQTLIWRRPLQGEYAHRPVGVLRDRGKGCALQRRPHIRASSELEYAADIMDRVPVGANSDGMGTSL